MECYDIICKKQLAKLVKNFGVERNEVREKLMIRIATTFQRINIYRSFNCDNFWIRHK